MKKAKAVIVDLAAKAGVVVNGANPWDIQVHNDAFYSRVMQQLYLGLGESYMDDWWDCERLDEFFFKVLRADLDKELKNWTMAVHYLKAAVVNYQTRDRALKVAQKHYDIGNDLYVPMLGKSMAYTCGYWKNAKNLDEAQEAKFDLVCKKIGLKPGMRVLDLGCGFGSFLKYAAEHYKITGVGMNISKEQIKFAKESCEGLPLEFKLMDYRDAEGTFDRVVSIGLTEHIGHKNYRTFLEVAHELPERRRPVPPPYHRLQSFRDRHRSVDQQIYLPERPPSFHRTAWRSDGTAVRHGGLAQLRRRLRQDAHGVAQEFRGELGRRSKKITITASTGCGPITCSPAPARSARGR